jgi:hypothetical protein
MSSAWVASGDFVVKPQPSRDYTPPPSGDDFDEGGPYGDPYHGESKWPAWKVSTFVILFCGAFWTGMVWLGVSLVS